MKYGWERKANRMFEHIADESHGDFLVLAVAVANVETGEAALLRFDEDDGHVVTADFWQDVHGDAETHYHDTVMAMRRRFSGGRK